MFPEPLTTYLEAPSLIMVASVTSNSRLSVALLPVGQGLTSLPPRTLLQVSRARVLGGPEGLVSIQERVVVPLMTFIVITLSPLRWNMLGTKEHGAAGYQGQGGTM